MDLLEYQGKQLFARHGVPVPAGGRRAPSRRRSRPPRRSATRAWSRRRCRSAAAASSAVSRSRATRTRRAQHAEAILGMDIRGLTVHEVWIEGASEIASEYYASVVFDRAAKAPLVMLSTKGGMDIEAVADEDPGRDRPAARRPAARAFRTSTAAGSPSRRASTPTSCGRSARCSPSSTTRSSPRRRRWSRSTR